MILRTVGIIGAITMLTLSGGSVALATTDTQSQNPDFTVSASLASRGTLNPDQATVGDPVDAALSVKDNKSWTFQPRIDEVKLHLTLQVPETAEPLRVTATIYMLPGTKITVPFSYTVPGWLPKGMYTLTLEAIEVSDPAAPPSSATATITIL
jgi:hypothetical protein